MELDDRDLGRIVLAFYKRNLQREQNLSLLSRLELKLYNTLDSQEVISWLPVQKQEQMLIIPTIDPNFRNIGLEWKANYRSPILWNLVRNKNGFERTKKLNDDSAFLAPYLLIRLYGICKPISLSHFREIPQSGSQTEWEEYDVHSAHYLADKLKLSTEMTAENVTGPWRRYYNDCGELDTTEHNLIYIRNSKYVVTFALQHIIDGNDHLLLPVAFYANPDYPVLLKVYELPAGMLTFYNSEQLLKHPHATVYLTDELAIATINESNSERIFCSYYGGDAVIERLDYLSLRGRSVVWLMITKPEQNEDKAYQKALTMAAYLHEHSIRCRFTLFEGCRWQEAQKGLQRASYKTTQTFSLQELLIESRKRGLVIPTNLEGEMFSLISARELRKYQPGKFLVEPIIREGSYTIMYGGTGVAKTWLALTIGLAVANQKDVFPRYWTTPGQTDNGKAKGKVLYIAGEMTLGDFGPRIERLLQEEKGENFYFCRPWALDLVKPEGQALVLKLLRECDNRHGNKNGKVELVIFDNLTTLSCGGELQDNFNKILYLIDQLKAQGIAVLLVHHENVAGKLRGAAKITDVADMQLHLVKGQAEKRSIALIIAPGKTRSVAQFDVPPLKAILDMKNSCSSWQVSALKASELVAVIDEEGALQKILGNKRISWEFMSIIQRVKTVVELRIRGCSDRQMERVLQPSSGSIAQFRKKYNITDDIIKECFQEAESEEFNQGNENGKQKDLRKPDIAASIITTILKSKFPYLFNEKL